MVPFEEDIHPKTKHCVTAEGPYCDNIFENHVEKGQAIEVGEASVGTTFRPAFHNQIMHLRRAGVKYFQKYSNTLQLLSVMNDYNYQTIRNVMITITII